MQKTQDLGLAGHMDLESCLQVRPLKFHPIYESTTVCTLQHCTALSYRLDESLSD